MKKRKIIISVLLIFFVTVAGVWGYFIYSQRVHAAVSNQEIVLEEGQELLYAKITSISGNEMDYVVLETQTVDLNQLENGRGRNGAEQETGGRSSGGGVPSGNGRSANGEMPPGGGEPFGGGQSFNGEIPAGNQNGNTEDSGTLSDVQKQNGKASREKSTAETQDRTMTTYTETEKTGQIQIPVGTDVETKLGTITTFSRLSNGDTIRMLMQKSDNGGEDLLKIWIVE